MKNQIKSDQVRREEVGDKKWSIKLKFDGGHKDAGIDRDNAMSLAGKWNKLTLRNNQNFIESGKTALDSVSAAKELTRNRKKYFRFVSLFISI